MEDKVLAFYVDDELKQQYFLTESTVVDKKLKLSRAIVDICGTVEKMEFEHISIWLKPENGGKNEKEK